MKSTSQPSFLTETRANDQGKRNFGSRVHIQ